MIRRHDLAVLVDSAEDHQVGAPTRRGGRGHLQRPEATGEGKLRLVGHILIAKDQNRMLLQCRARLTVRVVICGDVLKHHAAQLCGEARTQRDDVHGVSSLLWRWCKFPPKPLSPQPDGSPVSGRPNLLIRYGTMDSAFHPHRGKMTKND